MHRKMVLHIDNLNDLRENLTDLARDYEYACILDSNRDCPLFAGNTKYSKYDLIAGFSRTGYTKIITTPEELVTLSAEQKEWYLGFLTYDFKNKIEKLHSENEDYLKWPTLLFFQPEILFVLKNRNLEISVAPHFEWYGNIPEKLKTRHILQENSLPANLLPRFGKGEYLSRVKHIQELIHKGDIYEVNFCQEFYDHIHFDSYRGYIDLNRKLPSPFSAFLRTADKYLLCASPERFLCKRNDLLISQPIKGTIQRGSNYEEDEILINKLRNSRKERSENVMIVDLVRNDLSRVAKQGTVKVSELCGIYTFPLVHQLISTVEARTKTHSFDEIIRATFPMGSMTGAPKIEAMCVIEHFEVVKRGLYSGSVGYIDPDGNFDFNVVIRSLQYNARDQYLSYMAGSAITALSNPEKEYEECLLKVYGMNASLHNVGYA